MVEGLVRLMHSDAQCIGPINLGNPQEIAVGELARIIIDITGSSSRIRHLPLPENDPKRRCPDITRARELLGWQPTVDLREGLGRTVAYFDALLARRA
jgi:UDP-glucuronate decarboxylase